VGNSNAHDKKVAVNEWITSNPAAAAALMPLDVASVLSKISFSLDHPEVANLVSAAGVSLQLFSHCRCSESVPVPRRRHCQGDGTLRDSHGEQG
jgi:hypothetical protein